MRSFTGSSREMHQREPFENPTQLIPPTVDPQQGRTESFRQQWPTLRFFL